MPTEAVLLLSLFEMTWLGEVLRSPTRGEAEMQTKLNNKVMSPRTNGNSWPHMAGNDLKCPQSKING